MIELILCILLWLIPSFHSRYEVRVWHLAQYTEIEIYDKCYFDYYYKGNEGIRSGYGTIISTECFHNEGCVTLMENKICKETLKR